MASYADYANTERQTEIGKMMDAGHSSRKIADKMGIDSGYTRKQMRILKARAAKKERGEHITETPEGFGIKKTSTAYNKDGDVAFQWVIRTQDEEKQLEMIKAVIEELSREIKPAKPVRLAKKAFSADLLNLYTLTDCHVGMLAWHKEGGDDWDLKISEEILVSAFIAMMDGAPDAEVAIVGELGDFEHFDGFDAVTPTNRH